MQVQGLVDRGVPEHAVDSFLEKGIEELNPPQRKAVQEGLLDGESLVVSSPTASGKTLIATMAISRLMAEQDGKKALYLVPLKALGSEKYRDYREFFDGSADSNASDESSGAGGSASPDVDVALSVGDRDSSDRWIETKDLIVMTVEKLDAILRHNPSWVKDVDLVVVDEIHLLNDEGRGPTLEVTLTRLRELMEFQLLGLSATIKNADELADWLDCTLVDSDYRPVTLKEGVYHGDQVTFYPGDARPPSTDTNSGFVSAAEKREAEEAVEEAETEEMPVHDNHGRAVPNLLHHAQEQGNQAIAFVRSRKSAESEAENCGKVAEEFLSREEEKEVQELADRVRNVLGSPTKQCRRLARCVEQGAAFHHAGLLSQQRSMIEDAFRDGLIKSICATPTLAAGVSLPAYRIIIRDVKRYTDNGLNYIPVLEYKQMAGRAGRPEHHDHGEAIAVAKNPGDVEEVRDRYVLGETEDIYSKLAVEPVLRMHALGLIATRFVTDFDELMSFFDATFYAHQYGDEEKIRQKLLNVVENLEEYGFVEVDDEALRPTTIGKRVAELYIDPDTAHHLLDMFGRARDRSVEPLAYLHVLSETVEMKPRLRLRKGDTIDLEDILARVEDDLLEEPPEQWDDLEYRPFLEAFKTALMLQAWIQEEEEDHIMDKFNVTPGGVRAKVERADWLLYAAEELATLKEWDDVRKDVKKLRTRVKHGIREELLSLVRFKGVGRVRARKLHERDITTSTDIREASFNRLKNAVGKRTAEKLKEQVGQDNVFDKENIMDYFD